MQITYNYEGEGHDLRRDQAAMDYSFMLPEAQDPRLFHVDSLASQGEPAGDQVGYACWHAFIHSSSYIAAALQQQHPTMCTRGLQSFTLLQAHSAAQCS